MEYIKPAAPEVLDWVTLFQEEWISAEKNEGMTGQIYTPHAKTRTLKEVME